MEDTAQEDDQSSDELADVDNTDSESDVDNSASEGDVLDDDGTEENEDDSAVSSEEEEDTDDTEDASGTGKKVVPYARLQKTIEERNDLREQNKIFKALLQQQGVKMPGDKEEPDATKVKSVLAKYTPKQIQEAKELLHGVLKEEMGDMGTLKEQLQEMKRQQDAERNEKFLQQDDAKLVATLKEFKRSDGTLEFKKSEVEMQVQAWHKSGNPELQALAKAPYRTILREMRAIRVSKAGKKPKPAPHIPADSGEGSTRKFTPSGTKRVRPNPSDPTGWENRLSQKAAEMMTSSEE